MKHYLRYFIIGLIWFSLMLLVIPVSAESFRITASPQETAIAFEWTSGETVDVYIDGVIVSTATTNNKWFISHLHGQEEHEIQIIDSGNQSVMGTLSATTLHPEWVVIFLIFTLFMLFILLIAVLDKPVITIIVGGIIVSIALYTAAIANGYGGLQIIPYIFAILSGGFILLALWNIIIEKTRW